MCDTWYIYRNVILVRTGCCCQYRYILVYLDTILGLEKLKTGVSGYRRNSILITRRNAKRIVVNKVLCMLSYCGVPEVGMFWFMNEHVFVFVFVLNHFHFPAQLVGGFTLSDLLDKPWSQVGVVPSSPRYVPAIFIAHRVQHSHCSSIFIECC